MKKAGKHTTTGKPVGRKRVSPAKPKKSYIIYDSCYTCPLRVYIDVVCHGDLMSLVVEGEPEEKVVREAFRDIMCEFAELSGNGMATRHNTLLREVYLFRSQIAGMSICGQLVSMGELEDAVLNLNKLGVPCTVPGTAKDTIALIKKIGLKIRERNIRLKKAQKELESEKAKSDGGRKVKEQDFSEQLVELSRWAGFRLSTDMTLAEYATYMKKMREYSELLRQKRQKHG